MRTGNSMQFLDFSSHLEIQLEQLPPEPGRETCKPRTSYLRAPGMFLTQLFTHAEGAHDFVAEIICQEVLRRDFAQCPLWLVPRISDTLSLDREMDIFLESLAKDSQTESKFRSDSRKQDLDLQQAEAKTTGTCYDPNSRYFARWLIGPEMLALQVLRSVSKGWRVRMAVRSGTDVKLRLCFAVWGNYIL